MSKFFDRIRAMIYGPEQKPLTAEQMQTIIDGVKEAQIRMRSHYSWSNVQVGAALDMARTFPKGHAQHTHYLLMLKLRLVVQQYMQQMCLTMETVSSQVELAQLSTEMGAALKSATTLINGFQQDMPSFTSFVRDFMKLVAPMNEALNGGLNEMIAALDEMSRYTLDGVYSDEELEQMISGEAEAVKPVRTSTTKPSTPASGGDDMLASIERTLPPYRHPGGI